jgi:hypothetical protein
MFRWCCAEWRPIDRLSVGGSGQRRLGETEQLIGFGRRSGEPIVFRPEPGQLKLKIAYLGTQKGDLVE